jgi:hypothetical protein
MKLPSTVIGALFTEQAKALPESTGLRKKHGIACIQVKGCVLCEVAQSYLLALVGWKSTRSRRKI